MKEKFKSLFFKIKPKESNTVHLVEDVNEAIFHGNLEKLKQLVNEQNAPLNCGGNLSLYLASFNDDAPNNNLATIQWLMTEAGLNPYQKDEWGNNFLQYSCMHGYLNIVKWLIEDCHMAINMLNDRGEDLLHIAIANKKIDILKYLVAERDLPLTCKDGLNYNLLEKSVISQNMEALKWLVENHKIDVDIRDRHDNGVLRTAVCSKQKNIIEWLVNDAKIHLNIHEKILLEQHGYFYLLQDGANLAGDNVDNSSADIV